MIPLLFVAGAVAVLFFWPKPKAAGVTVGPPAADLFRVMPQMTPPAPPAPPPTADADPRPAIDRLLQVRDRLRETGRLDDANAKAVDQLALELIHGENGK
jgi:hypothetical protein